MLPSTSTLKGNSKAPGQDTILKLACAFLFVTVVLLAGDFAPTKRNMAIASSTTSTKEMDMPKLDLPTSTKHLVINIGSNLDPLMPDVALGPCAHAIAVEPVVGCQIPSHPQLTVLNAAVSDQAGVMSMRSYNKDGQSSSLANVAKEDWWNAKGSHDNGKLIVVPVVTLTALLNSIPSYTDVSCLMTDIQGLDFATIKAGADSVKERVTHLITEVWLADQYTYEAQNDLCRDWIPFMESLGYTLEKTANMGEGTKVKEYCTQWLKDHPTRPTWKESPGLNEDDAFWVRNDSVGQPFPEGAKLPLHKPGFTESDYATCT